MKTLNDVTKEELKEVLCKGWMTHDAMWFYHCLQESGIGTANKVNIAAVHSMALIEIKRLCKLLGAEKKPSYTYDEIVTVMEGALAVVKADFMQFDHSVGPNHSLCWHMRQCFAYDGILLIGAIDGYQCGILERIKGWLDGMGISYTMDPVIDGCLMHKTGECRGEFRFNL